MLRKLQRFLARLASEQRGQMLVLFVALIIAGLGAIMLSVDVGWWLTDRRDVQNDADAMALAGAQELPDTAAASDAADNWALRNGVDLTQIVPPSKCNGTLQGDYCFEDQNGDGEMDLIRVGVRRQSRSLMAQVFAVGDPDVGAAAAAAKVQGVGSCVMPWGIVAANTDPADHYGLDPQALYVFQDTNSNSPGNYGAISLYGTGASVYKDSIINDCTNPKSNACTEDAVIEEGETLEDCQPKTGKLGATTANALAERYAPPPDPSFCDVETYQEAVTKSEWADCAERAVPLAIIDSFPPQGASSDITVYGIAFFYVAGWNKTGKGDSDGDPQKGYVWGYLLTNMEAMPAWQVIWGTSDNPFAPVTVALVE